MLELQQLEDISKSPLPDYEDLMSCLDEAISVLESEEKGSGDFDYRKGGLLDFLDSDGKEKPVLVVPDIHGRDYFLINLLKHKLSPSTCSGTVVGEPVEPLEEITVFDALAQEKIFVVCVGDAMHGELRAVDRWEKAFEDYKNDIFTGDAMKEEMRENLSVVQICCRLKCAFPKNFHFLKGNHENIMNNCEDGNRSFRKICDEGNMTYDFVREYYDDIILHLLDLYEKNLPLVALFKNCVISHAEPAFAFTRKEIETYKKSPTLTEKVVFGLTWTRNDEIFENTVEETEKNLYGKKRFDDIAKNEIAWFGGHRPVEKKFALRQDGRYIQIHNPYEENYVLVLPNRPFNPEIDIISL